VILLDANILLYAYNTRASQHRAAKSWLETALTRPAPVRLSWFAIVAFLRLSTDARVYPDPFSMQEATTIVDDWLGRPNLDVLEPTERHWSILRQLLSEGQARGPLATDAHLAALAIEHGATLCTTDRDFARFPGLKWTNPIA
jgi:uncharacterized protein